MQYALKVFETEDHDQFRTILINGEPWFVLGDCCKALDIKNVSDAAARLDDDEKGVAQADTPGGIQTVRVINESGLYTLILRSDKPSAKRFKKWITSQVLPTIRKTGVYAGNIPAFIRRFNENADRVDPGYFSIINELVIRLWGKLERIGYIMPDRAMDGKELRPDISVGRGFSSWLQKNFPEAANDHGSYVHSTPEFDCVARQYKHAVLPLYLQFVEEVWIPECAEDYFKARDPCALPYLPKLLIPSESPKPGISRERPIRQIRRNVHPRH